MVSMVRIRSGLHHGFREWPEDQNHISSHRYCISHCSARTLLEREQPVPARLGERLARIGAPRRRSRFPASSTSPSRDAKKARIERVDGRKISGAKSSPPGR